MNLEDEIYHAICTSGDIKYSSFDYNDDNAFQIGKPEVYMLPSEVWKPIVTKLVDEGVVIAEWRMTNENEILRVSIRAATAREIACEKI